MPFEKIIQSECFISKEETSLTLLSALIWAFQQSITALCSTRHSRTKFPFSNLFRTLCQFLADRSRQKFIFYCFSQIAIANWQVTVVVQVNIKRRSDYYCCHGNTPPPGAWHRNMLQNGHSSAVYVNLMKINCLCLMTVKRKSLVVRGHVSLIHNTVVL